MTRTQILLFNFKWVAILIANYFIGKFTFFLLNASSDGMFSLGLILAVAVATADAFLVFGEIKNQKLTKKKFPDS